MAAGLDDGTNQERALLLLGRVLPRILLRTGWDVSATGSDFTVSEFLFQGSDGVGSGINHERLVLVAGDGAGTSQLVKIGMGSSLDVDRGDRSL